MQYGELVCERCSPGCVTCDDVTPCTDVIMTPVVLLGVQVFTMAVSVAVGIAVIRLRKTKATMLSPHLFYAGPVLRQVCGPVV